MRWFNQIHIKNILWRQNVQLLKKKCFVSYFLLDYLLLNQKKFAEDHHHHQIILLALILFLAICFCWPLLLISPQDNIPYPHRAKECTFFPVVRALSIWRNLQKNDVYVLLILLGWFVRWEVSDCTVAVMWGAATRICSKGHVTFLCSSNFALSVSVSVIMTWL